MSHWDASLAAPSPSTIGPRLWETGRVNVEVGPPESPGQWLGPYDDVVSVEYGPYKTRQGETDLGDGALHSCGQQAEFFIPIAHAVVALEAARIALSKWPRSIEAEPVETVRPPTAMSRACFPVEDRRVVEVDGAAGRC